MNDLACAFTGHRPARFSFGYDESDSRCVKLKALMAKQIGMLIDAGVSDFYSGMALGVDQWAADSVLDAKRKYKGIRLIAALPCETQADRWSEQQRTKYFNVLERCDEVVTISKHYTRSCMFERNRFLVDHADYLMAVYDGDDSGGTAYTVKYGKQKGRQLIIIHPDTLAVTNL